MNTLNVKIVLNQDIKRKMLVGLAPKNHVRLALDEIEGLSENGFNCIRVMYGGNSEGRNPIFRSFGVIVNAIKLVITLYKTSPEFLYLNSRFEPIGCVRDFLSLLLIRITYFRKLKVIIKSHGSDLSILSTPNICFKRIIIPFLTHNVDRWFFLSSEEKDIICDYNKKMGDKIIVTSNIVDPERSVTSASFREKYGIKDDKFIFLYVGRIVRVKGVFSIIESIVSFEFKEACRFIFVGDGRDLNELKERVSQLNLDKYVSFTGFVTDNICDHFYANAHALIYPTYDTEGFPMALFKSVAAGLPIITTKIRAAKDHLNCPDNVLWVDGTSPESVGKAITEIYQNDDIRISMSENNKELGKNFSVKSICEQMTATFLSI